MKLKFIPVLKRIAIIVFGNVNYLGKKNAHGDEVLSIQ